MKVSIEELIHYGISFCVLVLPFIFLPKRLYGYEAPKLFFLLLVIQGLLFIAFFFLHTRSKGSIQRNRLVMIVLLYTAIVCIANLYGLDPRTSLLGGEWRSQGFLLLISCVGVVYLLQGLQKGIHAKSFAIFTTGIWLTGSVLAIIGIIQFFAVYYGHSTSVLLYQKRVMSIFGNPNFFGGYMAMVLPFILMKDPRIPGKLHHIFALIKVVTIVLVILGVFLSGSRAAVLAVGVVLLGYRFEKRKHAAWKLLGISVFLLIVIVFALWQSISPMFMGRVSHWDNRKLIWNAGVEAITERPILGYGQENFELIYPKERKQKVDNAHNIFIETAISSGLVGLGLFIMIFLLAYRQATAPVRLSLLAFLIIAQFNPLSIAHIGLFWYLVGSSRESYEKKSPKPSG